MICIYIYKYISRPPCRLRQGLVGIVRCVLQLVELFKSMHYPRMGNFVNPVLAFMRSKLPSRFG